MSDIICSIVVCTLNRPDKLKRCLTSLSRTLSAEDPAFEFLLVDNSPDRNAMANFMEFKDSLPRARFISEPKTGLARARNKGIAEASGIYLFFLDDDAWVNDGFAHRLLDTITAEDFDAFGAHVVGYYPPDAPRWTRQDYYHPDTFTDKREELKFGYLHGGASAYRLEALKILGGYNTDLGMSGSRLAYGEDTELEKRLRARGFRIGYDPELQVHHEVRYRTVIDMLHSSYLRTLAFYRLHEERLTGKVMRSVAFQLWQSVKHAVGGIIRMSFKKEYRIQNWFIDAAEPIIRAWVILKIGGPQYFNRGRTFFRKDPTVLQHILNHFQARTPDIHLVQLGACDGHSFDPVHPFVERFQWKSVIAEPMPHLIPELEANYARQPQVTIAPVAIAGSDGSMELEYVDPGVSGLPDWTKGLASMRPERNALNPLFHLNTGWQDHIKKAEVKTLSWATFKAQYGISAIDVLVIDVEGMEYEILKQIDDLPPLVILEFSNLPVQEWHAIMKRFNEEQGGYFILQFSDTDIIAVRKKKTGNILRLQLNLPLI